MNGTLLSLNQLLHNDWLFEIPIYQRGYAWEEENLRDLWDDISITSATANTTSAPSC